MKPICPYCRYVFDHDAPKGQLYRCPECRELFHAGEDVIQHISTNGSIKVMKACDDSKETPKVENEFIQNNTTSKRETLPDTNNIVTNIEPQSGMKTTENRKNKENVFRQMIHEYFEIPRFIKNYYATSKVSQDASPKQNRVPIVVRIYGTIFMVGGFIGIISVFLVPLYLAKRYGFENLDISIFHVIVGFVISLIPYRIGIGLRKGQRRAVRALCLFALIGPIVVIGWTLEEGVSMIGTNLLLILGVWGITYLPPIFSAFGHWDAFSKGGEIG